MIRFLCIMAVYAATRLLSSDLEPAGRHLFGFIGGIIALALVTNKTKEQTK